MSKIRNWTKVDADEWKNTKKDETIYINVTGPNTMYGVIYVDEMTGDKELLYENKNITEARKFAIDWMRKSITYKKGEEVFIDDYGLNRKIPTVVVEDKGNEVLVVNPAEPTLNSPDETSYSNTILVPKDDVYSGGAVDFDEKEIDITQDDVWDFCFSHENANKTEFDWEI